MQQKILQIILAIGLTFICSRATAQAPSWTVSPSDFENSMTVTAVLSIEGALSDNPNDKVAAFVNGQIRGVASPDVDVPSTGQKVVFLQIYSNASGGETVRFKIYQASSNRIIDAVNEIAFTNNSTIGNSTNPFVIGDNQAPTDLLISNTSISENAGLNSQVASFFGQDNDIGETFTYQLVNGAGDTDNGKFSISGNGLLLQSSLDFEMQASLEIRVRATDSKNGFIEKMFALSVSNGADGPTDIILSHTDFDENRLVGALVTDLETVDQDENDSFTYSLVDDAGGAFSIQANQLVSEEVFNFEETSNYLLIIRTTDGSGLSFDKTINIAINDVNDAPSALLINNDNINENLAVNSFIGLLSTEDEDVNESTTYSFVRGNNDNARFLIVGDSLKTFAIFNHEEKDTRLVQVRATDSGGATIEKFINIDVNDVNDPVTDIVLEGNSIAENSTDSVLIGNFRAVDEDGNDSYTYTMVNGIGSEGNQAFLIDGNQLKSRANLNYEQQISYSIRIQAIDQSGTGPERIFTIEVEDTNDPPTDISIDQLSLNENLPSGTSIGIMSTTDEDVADEFSYELISDPGNAFTIDNNQLKSNLVFNFEDTNRYPITIRSTDKEGESVDKDFMVRINDSNDAPTALNLSNASILENQPSNTFIGILSTEDVDAVENTTYSFVNGNNNNSSFFMSGDSLKSFQIFNHEETPTLLVEISARDKAGIEITEAFVINVRDDNDASISFQMDQSQINENMPIGTEIGQFSTIDEDEADNFTYSLVTGFGSAGNSAFRITDNVLFSDSIFDYEQQRIFTIRVQVTDQSGDGPQQVFGILINDVNDAPREIVVSNLALAENNEEGKVIGTLSTVDQDIADSFFYDLAEGGGDEGNADFLILDNQLVARKTFDYEEKNEYSIRLRTTDVSEAVHEQQVTINILPVNEPPLILPNQTFEVFEDASESELVGLVEVQDQDDQSFGFDLLSEGVPFTVDSLTGEILVLSSGLDFEKQQSYTLSIQAQDSGGLSHIETIFIQVLDVIESELPVNNFVSDNNDGKNDFFFIQNVDLYSGYSLFIFSGSGVLVYSQRDYQNEWYGQADNGKQLPEGVYYYKFTPPSEGRSFKGKVTLIR